MSPQGARPILRIGLLNGGCQRKMGLGRKAEAHQVLTTISASEPPLIARRSMPLKPALRIQDLFEFCVSFCRSTVDCAWTCVYDHVRSINDLPNKSFICGVFRWSDRAAF